MEAIPTTFLSKIKTISALKTLVAFFAIKEKLGKDEFEFSVPKVAQENDMSENSVRNGIRELESLKFIESVERNVEKCNVYRLCIAPSKVEVGGSKVEVPPPSKVEVPTSKVAVAEKAETREEYSFATAARKKKEVQQSEIEKDIYSIDFNNINFYNKDINSFTVINKNVMMNEEELGKLANRILREVFLPLAKPVIPTENRARAMWYQKQNNLLKSLLVEHRAEQVVAAIHYWTLVSPLPKGLTSVYFFRLTKRTKHGLITNLMVALHHYKAEYIANEHEYNREEIEQKQAERAKREQEEKEAAAKRAEEVASMKPDDFVAGMLGRFKLNVKRDE
jgi:hypothetical protein